MLNHAGYYGDMSKDEHIELLQMKDNELDGMKNEILKEQQVNSHVHMVQEKELIDKDRAITFLNKQLGVKQKEIDCLRKLNKKVCDVVCSYFADCYPGRNLTL